MTASSQPGPLTARHATLEDLAALLRDQQARKALTPGRPRWLS